MAKWNLRIVRFKQVVDRIHDEPSEYLELQEVFYNSIGKPVGHTAATVGGDDIEEIQKYLEWAMEATKKPILDSFSFDKAALDTDL